MRDDTIDADGAWGDQVHATGQALEVLTGNAVQFVQVTGSQLATAVREDQPLIAGRGVPAGEQATGNGRGLRERHR